MSLRSGLPDPDPQHWIPHHTFGWSSKLRIWVGNFKSTGPDLTLRKHRTTLVNNRVRPILAKQTGADRKSSGSATLLKPMKKVGQGPYLRSPGYRRILPVFHSNYRREMIGREAGAVLGNKRCQCMKKKPFNVAAK